MAPIFFLLILGVAIHPPVIINAQCLYIMGHSTYLLIVQHKFAKSSPLCILSLCCVTYIMKLNNSIFQVCRLIQSEGFYVYYAYRIFFPSSGINRLITGTSQSPHSILVCYLSYFSYCLLLFDSFKSISVKSLSYTHSSNYREATIEQEVLSIFHLYYIRSAISILFSLLDPALGLSTYREVLAVGYLTSVWWIYKKYSIIIIFFLKRLVLSSMMIQWYLFLYK